MPGRVPEPAVLPGLRAHQLCLHRGGGDRDLQLSVPLLHPRLEQPHTVSIRSVHSEVYCILSLGSKFHIKKYKLYIGAKLLRQTVRERKK